jgi:hypothetical protein
MTKTKPSPFAVKYLEHKKPGGKLPPGFYSNDQKTILLEIDH